jgi:hypothetical protein
VLPFSGSSVGSIGSVGSVGSGNGFLNVNVVKDVALHKVVLKNRSKDGHKVANVALTAPNGAAAVLPAGAMVAPGATTKLVHLSDGPIHAGVLQFSVSLFTKAGAEVTGTFVLPIDSMDRGTQFHVQPVSGALKPLGAKHNSSGVLTLTVN